MDSYRLVLESLRDEIERVISRKIKIEQFIRWYEGEFLDLMEKSGILDDTDTDMLFLNDYIDDFAYYEEQPEVRAEYDRYYGEDKFFELVKELRTRIDGIILKMDSA